MATRPTVRSRAPAVPTVALTLAVAAALALVPARALAGADPADRWSTFETPHFRIHFPQGGEDLASRAARIAEEAYVRCRSFLGFEPSETVEVVLADDQDQANGFTSVYPYDHVLLLASPPGPESELASYDDYLRVLFYHEYAHVLHMDQVSGLPAAVNRVLGKTVLPNGATNSWFIEGFATFVESRLTAAGRIGSPWFDMLLRSAALDGTFADLDELTAPPLKLPRGAAPYLYGAYFVDFLYARGGGDPLVEFIRQYGARLVPFAMNLVARRTFGADFVSLYREFRSGIETRARAVAAGVRAAGERAGTPLTTDGEYKDRPVFSPDSRAVLYVGDDGRSTGGVFRLDLATGERKRVVDCYGGCDSLATDGNGILVVHGTPWRIYRSYGDLYRAGPDGREHRLSRRARARDASPSGAGEDLYVTAEFDRVAMVARQRDTGTVRVVVPAGRFTGMGTPRVVPGTGRVVFSGAQAGRWDLWTVPLDGRAVPAPLTSDRCLDRDPYPSPDGRWVVFASDAGGIFNLHAVEIATGRRRQATNVVGGAFWPAVSPDGRRLAFTTWSGRGSDLATLPFAPETWPEPAPGARCRHDDIRLDVEAPAVPEAAEPPSPPRRYDPLPSFLPRALTPYGVFSTLRESRLGLRVTALDALQHHAFEAALDTALTSFRPAFSAAYTYAGQFPSLSLAFGTWPGRARAWIGSSVLTVPTRDYQLSTGAILPIPLRDRNLQVSLSYSVDWTVVSGQPPDPGAATEEPRAPSVHRRASLGLSFQHDSTEAFTYSISPEKGFQTGLHLAVRHPWLGAEGRALTVSSWFHEYVALPWARGHVLAIQASGMLSVGDPADRDLVTLGGLGVSNPLADLLQPRAAVRALRGFAPDALVGDAGLLGNLEYRFPILQIHRGMDTLPVVARRLWGKVFADLGATWWDLDPGATLGWSVGAELDLSLSLFLAVNGVLRLGYAHGFGPGGGDAVFLLLTQ